MAAGVDAVYVGYKSNPQAIPDVQSGLLTFMMIDTVNAKIAMDRGALKGLFVTDSERYAAVPDMPTAAEAGLARGPAHDLDRLLCARRARRARSCSASMPTSAPSRHMPEVLERLAALGGTPRLMSPDEFAAFTRSEKERWGQIIRRANIKVE